MGVGDSPEWTTPYRFSVRGANESDLNLARASSTLTEEAVQLRLRQQSETGGNLRMKPSNTNSPASSLSPGERQFLLAVGAACNSWIGLVRRPITASEKAQAAGYISGVCSGDGCSNNNGTGIGTGTGSGNGTGSGIGNGTGSGIGSGIGCGTGSGDGYGCGYGHYLDSYGYGDGFSNGSGRGFGGGGLPVDVELYTDSLGWTGHERAKRILVEFYEDTVYV